MVLCTFFCRIDKQNTAQCSYMEDCKKNCQKRIDRRHTRENTNSTKTNRLYFFL